MQIYIKHSTQIISKGDNQQLASNVVTLSFLVPTECRLPPQTIALIVKGAFAMVIALFSATVTVIDGIIAVWTGWNAKRIQVIQERMKKNKYEIRRSELCL